MRIGVVFLIMVSAIPAIGKCVTLESEVVGIGNFGGSPDAKAKLLERGFVVTDETYRQICSFYI